jgi:hypothetical protein
MKPKAENKMGFHNATFSCKLPEALVVDYVKVTMNNIEHLRFQGIVTRPKL